MRRLAIDKWLLAQPVARPEEQSLLRIPNSKCEHSPQVLDATHTMRFIKMENYFGVALRAKTVALVNERCAQFTKIVNLPVEYDPNCRIFIRKWRVCPLRQINDRKSPLPKAYIRRRICPLRVWTPVRDGSAHPQNRGFRYRRAAEVDLASYSAHFLNVVQLLRLYPDREATSVNPHPFRNARMALTCGPKLFLIAITIRGPDISEEPNGFTNSANLASRAAGAFWKLAPVPQIQPPQFWPGWAPSRD